MSASPLATPSTAPGPSTLRGALTGLAPIALFVLIAAVTSGATVLVRVLTASQPYLTQLPESLVTLGVGLALAFAAWIAGFIWALRRQRDWSAEGASGPAAATLLALVVSALLLLAPIILAIALPQHPAHPAP